MYADGEGVTQDNKKALEYFTKAAQQGFPQAQYNLAYMYENIFPDLEKAKFWYMEASKNHIPEADQALERLSTVK